MNKETRTTKRLRRHTRVTSHIRRSRGAGKPRLCVFRSLKHISVQLIDDEKGITLAFATDIEVQGKGKKPLEISREVGKLLAEKALKKDIKEAVFDRAGYKYHGNVKAIAEGAREGGLKL
ncbi:MAG: 50S ribosomal protein L18 [bacterium]|nr:50S ribosomal protein L18 [bacterium]